MKTYLLPFLILFLALFSIGATDFLDLPHAGPAKPHSATRTPFLDVADTRPAQWRPAPHKPGDIVRDSDWVILPKTDIYEVVTSQVGLESVRILPMSGIKELTEPYAKRFTGHYYSCPPGKRPYLLRAVYEPAGFGTFRVERRNNDLAVVWDCLGTSSAGLAKSALVVNLDFEPDQIYNELSCPFGRLFRVPANP